MSIKKIWNKLKYWQKGGSIAAMTGIVVILSEIIYFQAFSKISSKHPPNPVYLIYSFLVSPSIFPKSVSIVLYFIIGASIAYVIHEGIDPAPSSDKPRLFRIIAYLVILFYLFISLGHYWVNLNVSPT